MNQVGDFFRKLFDTADFPPRWHCGRWSDFHGWLYIISDLMIWSAYFVIPIIIVRYISKKYDARFVRLYFLFAAFILACGSTHLMDAIVFWHPLYRVSALLKFITGIISWITVFYLIRLMPLAFTLKTAEQLESEVTQRKIAEEQLKLNLELLNEAQEIAKLGHWQWDVRTNKLNWSKTTLEIYGVGEGSPFSYEEYLELIHPDDRSYVEAHIKTAFETKDFPKFHHRILLRSGEIKTVTSKGELILGPDNEVEQMIGTVQDVTEQKKFEQELLLKTQQLEATNKELEKFASIASHDLREPLRKIITFSSMLEHDLAKTLDEKTKTYIEKIKNASERMQKLIDDLLTFSMLNPLGTKFEKVNLNDVVEQVVSDMEVLVQATQTKIDIQQLPVIEGNLSLLRQLFQNLISNAIKYSKKEVSPEITIYSELVQGKDLAPQFFNIGEYAPTVFDNPKYWENEQFCQIHVIDNGIGFDNAYLEKIFLIFQRLHNKQDYEGTGIGLAVCKKVTEIHHGQITARSVQGAGAEFIIILPLSQKNFRSN